MRSILSCFLALCTCSWLSLAMAAGDPNLQVKIKRNQGKVIIDINMLVAVTPQIAFDVMTDYNHMSSYLSNISSSKIIQKDGNKLVVEQKGKASSGPISFSFDTVREITLLPPNEVHSKIIGGSIKQGESHTLITPEERSTRIVVHSESTAPAIMPPLVGVAFVEGQTRKQYQLLRDEMVKRQRAIDSKVTASPTAAPATPLLAPSSSPMPAPLASPLPSSASSVSSKPKQ